ncbi:MAG: hypothetical protein N2447_09570 [Thermoanaerobaculum sp.]|nr:hypothetical protein [Thermoanaerobaculum sp.]
MARGKGDLEASLGPVAVKAGAETEVTKPLELALPCGLQVRVDPPVMPSGRGWARVITPLAGDGQQVWELEVGEEGTVVGPRLRPGLYAVSWSAAPNPQEVWRQQNVQVLKECTLRLSVPMVKVVGRGRESGTPLPALLAFGGWAR